MKNLPQERQFLNFSLEYGCHYLSAGGPSNRLEEQITSFGHSLGLQTNVFGTPTSLFISIENSATGMPPFTALGRIKEYRTNLNHLCWLESLIEDLSKKKISIEAGTKILSGSKFKKSIYSRLQKNLAAFIVGVAVSWSNFKNPSAALLSGLITFFVYELTGPAMAHILGGPIFRDFLGSFFTFFMASLAATTIRAPIDAFAIGGVILIVPGLTLTTAVSELADQNFLSGTAKLMKGILTLLSIGVAYVLFDNLNADFQLKTWNGENTFHMDFSAAVATFISVSAFSILFQIPKKALLWAGLTGLCSWFVFHSVQSPKNIVLASFLASFTVGTISLALGSKFGTPSQVYSVPGIIALVPGMLALSSFRSFADGHGNSGVDTAFKVALMTGTTAFGLFFARIPFVFFHNLLKILKLKKVRR